MRSFNVERVNNNKNNNGNKNDESTVFRGRLFSRDGRHRRLLLRGGAAVAALLVFAAWLTIGSKEQSSLTEKGRTSGGKSSKRSSSTESFCSQFCPARVEQRKRNHGGADLLRVQDLVQNLEGAKLKLGNELRQLYGSHYDKLMLDNDNFKFRQGFDSPTDISVSRFVRKLKMKVLEMQLSIRDENNNLEGCNCNDITKDSEKKTRRSLKEGDKNERVLPPVDKTYSKFVWATGGHSAAAGHGNLQNETYTAYMEHAAKPIFESVGINFVGRNYAMGGMSSAPELALCQESIFGIDADVLTWDFGMTDVPHNWKHALYLSRAGVHRNHPAVVSINIHGFDNDLKVGLHKDIENRGVAAFYLKGDSIRDMEDPLPDMLGMNQKEIDAEPDYVRYFKCNKEIEKDDPGCGDHKYNEAVCPNRRHKAPWHPGFKVNALYGNLMAFFLIENLGDAIQELLNEDYDPVQKLEELKKEEEKEYEELFVKSSDLPKETISDFIDETLMSQIDPNIIYNHPALCYTALLPSEIRYEGILKGEDEETNKTAILNHEQGIMKVAAEKERSQDGMRIVKDDPGQPPCEVLTFIDYKDYFYSNEKDGWTHLTIPNDSEKKYVDITPYKGMVVICFIKCDWNKCDDGDVRNTTSLQMKVNDVDVVDFTPINQCAILKHQKGYVFPSSNNKYKIEVFVVPAEMGQPKHYTRITSMILF